MELRSVTLVVADERALRASSPLRVTGNCLEWVLDRMEVQSALEALGARWAAERGIPSNRSKQARDCLSEIDHLLGQMSIGRAALMRYVRLNNLFHRSILELAQCPTLGPYAEDEPATIFSLPEVTRVMLAQPARLHALLVIEQDQHHRIVEAVEAGMGARAESLVREHARLARRHVTELM
jgi:GntR family transcriptional regulator, vanillate catabolism transcriptional regulator